MSTDEITISAFNKIAQRLEEAYPKSSPVGSADAHARDFMQGALYGAFPELFGEPGEELPQFPATPTALKERIERRMDEMFNAFDPPLVADTERDAARKKMETVLAEVMDLANG